jgi:hypothetical protein
VNTSTIKELQKELKQRYESKGSASINNFKNDVYHALFGTSADEQASMDKRGIGKASTAPNGYQPNANPQGTGAPQAPGYLPENSLQAPKGQGQNPPQVGAPSPSRTAGISAAMPAAPSINLPDRTAGMQANFDKSYAGMQQGYDALGKPVNLPDQYAGAIAEREKRNAEPQKWGQAGLAMAAGLLGGRNWGQGLSQGIQGMQPYISQIDAQRRADKDYIEQLKLQQAGQGRQDVQYNQGRMDAAQQGKLSHSMDPYNAAAGIAAIQGDQDKTRANLGMDQQRLGLGYAQLQQQGDYNAQRLAMYQGSQAAEAARVRAIGQLVNSMEYQMAEPEERQRMLAELQSAVGGSSGGAAGVTDWSDY